MTTSGAPLNPSNASIAAAAAAARMARASGAAAATAGLSNAQAIQMQMNQQATTTTQLQQRAAAAAQYLNSGQRKATSRDVQTMLEKNDAALRAWSYLHAQQPPKHLIPEHKAWAHKCLALRQQIGARLEVLASLADKQVAQEDSSGKTTSSQSTPSIGVVTSAATKKSTTTRPITVPKAPPIKIESTPGTQAHNQTTQAQVLAAQQARQTRTPPVPSPGMNFPDQSLSMPVQTSTTGMFFNATSAATATTAVSYPVSTVPSTAAAIATTSSMPMVSSSQGFNPQAFATSTGYVSGIQPQQGGQTAFMNPTNQANFMMGNAMTAGMMNPQMMGMQMAGQMPMAMNGGAMYDPNMFASAGYMGMSANHLPTDPFNASFQMQPGFNVPFGMMNNAQMMGAMGGMMPMQNAQMMMNPTAFNMAMPQQQQQQFQQNQFSTTSFPNPNQPQQQQSVPVQPPAPAQSLQVSTTFSDDDTNIFEGLGDDAFLSLE